MSLDYQLKNIIIVYGISAIIFFSIVLIREIINQEFKFLNNSFAGCNIWCYKHILLYTVLSYLAPKYWWFLLGFGLLFEFVELYLSNYSRFIISKINTDILYNSIGILLGIVIHRFYPKKIDLHKLFKEYVVFYKSKKFNST
tara:strand:+ start:93 stop:518 length:426 start_codon:yes stop_codon:yes gene_type:complete